MTAIWLNCRLTGHLPASFRHEFHFSGKRLMSGASSQTLNSPLTYPDQRRDDNLVEFFLSLTGAFLKKVLLAPLVWLFDVLP